VRSGGEIRQRWHSATSPSPVARRTGEAHFVAFLSCPCWSLGGMVPPSQTVRSPILSWLVTYTTINVKITSTSDRRGCHLRIIIGVIIIAMKIIILHSPANFQGCRVPCLARVRRQPPIINGVAESRTLDRFFSPCSGTKSSGQRNSDKQ
jgi:hypothetical protein